MMSSSWKISVFGIVALMLAFGLLTTDALAQGPSVDITVTGDGRSARRGRSDHFVRGRRLPRGKAATPKPVP